MRSAFVGGTPAPTTVVAPTRLMRRHRAIATVRPPRSGSGATLDRGANDCGQTRGWSPRDTNMVPGRPPLAGPGTSTTTLRGHDPRCALRLRGRDPLVAL